jgi:hypothetical protein
MTDKLKRLIRRIRTRIFYSRCYNKMESLAIAVFGMCSGALNPEYYTEKCLNCPYFIQVKESKQ